MKASSRFKGQPGVHHIGYPTGIGYEQDVCPPGPTGRISRSSESVWLKPFNFTTTLLMLPGIPDTFLAGNPGAEKPPFASPN